MQVCLGLGVEYYRISVPIVYVYGVVVMRNVCVAIICKTKLFGVWNHLVDLLAVLQEHVHIRTDFRTTQSLAMT